jgi:diketogulonate reductase-like aldo/keto reductase
VETAVYEALRAGYRHIDGAAVYKNEAEVGAGLRRAFEDGVCTRDDVFITSKLWVGDAENPAAAVDKTLADLGLESLDLWLLHWPFLLSPGATIPFGKEDILGYDPDAVAKVWAEMEKVHASGKAKAIGVRGGTEGGAEVRTKQIV